METNWRPAALPSPVARVIQVDIDAAEIGRSVPAQLGIIGDIRAVLEDLLAAIHARAPARRGSFRANARIQECAAELKRQDVEIAEEAESRQRPIHPLRVIRAVRAALPRVATVAIDIGCLAQHMVASFPVFPVHLPRSLILPSSFYGMGFAGSALPVARQVYPDRPAVGFIGDGSFQMKTRPMVGTAMTRATRPAIGVNITYARILCFLGTAPFLGMAGAIITLQKLRVARPRLPRYRAWRSRQCRCVSAAGNRSPAWLPPRAQRPASRCWRGARGGRGRSRE